ncbi:putative allantoate deiminase [Hibiscus syriacus]|uniref:allantoate deiminase n=1 Tax=Hibiscus syriacus TaxID=106335 RepID=A0A6A2WI26_HIBSY|nr:putative allantoate deiminase [Hibiscus syriacus]
MTAAGIPFYLVFFLLSSTLSSSSSSSSSLLIFIPELKLLVSDADDYLERTFMSPASVRAGILIREWMEDAGLRTWMDSMGNLHGRVEGMNPSAQALLIGSHMVAPLDTVVDAGIFDGSLGIISAISALKALKSNGKLGELKRPVISFSDEEGVRFQSTFLGSAAVAGVLPLTALNTSDKSGVTLQDVLKGNSIEITEESLLELKYDPSSVWGYIEVRSPALHYFEDKAISVILGYSTNNLALDLEYFDSFMQLHIEQGPVLEWTGFPLAVVKGIAGQTRMKVTVRGSQGHAGTVPMSMRRDPMAAAAELIVLLENLCKHPREFLSDGGNCNEYTLESLSTSLVCTVGEISTWPSASNVIPGQARNYSVTFTVDLRTIDDVGREAVVYELSNQIYKICDRRSVSCIIERKHDANAVICDQELSSQLRSAAYTAVQRMTGEIQEEVPVLMSGAGHDAMAISHLTKVGMLFVRCRGGISHSPEEHVLDDDVWAAGLVVLAFLESHM